MANYAKNTVGLEHMDSKQMVWQKTGELGNLLVNLDQSGDAGQFTPNTNVNYVRLYEELDQAGLAFEFQPNMNYGDKIGNGYMRIIRPISLKSIDINVPRVSADYDPLRYVRVWQMYGNDSTASTESGFYNAYTEPEWVTRSSPKYQLIAIVLPGEHLVANVTDRVRRVLLEINV